VITAENDEELVVAANRHVAEAHDSFELEEVILDAAEDV
jgi:predicted small metal-binding protein